MKSDRALPATLPIVNYAAPLGAAGIYLFAFSLWLSTAGAHIGLGLMLLATLADANRRTALWRDPLLWLAALFAVYLAVYVGIAALTDPSATESIYDAAWMWLKPLAVLLLVAVWLGGDEKRVGLALGLALLGLAIRVILETKATGIATFLKGSRSGFGFEPILFGLFAATGLHGLLVLAPRLFSLARGRVALVTLFACWLVVLAIVAQALVVSQTRNAWLSVLLVYPITLGIALAASARRSLQRSSWIRVAPAIMLAVAVAAVVTVHNWSTIKTRVTAEPSAWHAIIHGEIDNVPDGSIGARLRLWELAVDKWLERPVFGWGPQSSNELIKQSNDPHIQSFSHFHNTYYEFVVELGLVGAALLVIGAIRIGRTLIEAWRRHIMPLDYALYAIGGIGLLMISSLSDFIVWATTWKLHFGMLTAIVYGYHYRLAAGRAPAHRAPIHL